MIRKILFDNDITIQTKKHILPISYGIINSLFLIEYPQKGLKYLQVRNKMSIFAREIN